MTSSMAQHDIINRAVGTLPLPLPLAWRETGTAVSPSPHSARQTGRGDGEETSRAQEYTSAHVQEPQVHVQQHQKQQQQQEQQQQQQQQQQQRGKECRPQTDVTQEDNGSLMHAVGLDREGGGIGEDEPAASATAAAAAAGGAGDEAEEDWRHDGLSFGQYMLAGSVAGMVEHMAMFPVDTVKTRMQAIREAAGATSSIAMSSVATSPSTTATSSAAAARIIPSPSTLSFQHHPSVLRALASILRHEGARGLYRGIGAMGLGAGPAHAVYFSVYEWAKEALGGNERGHQPLAHAAAGAMATVGMDAVLTPMDVVKQRLQLKKSPYSGVVDCCRKVMEQEGLRAFYTSYRTTLVMNVPFTAVHFATYEAAKRVLGGGKEADEGRLSTHLLAGGVAGAVAGAVTNPLDVVKTRLQCQGVCGVRRYKSGSVVGALRSLVAEEGAGVLLNGIQARVLFHAPAAAICWSTYEACKSGLKAWNESSSSSG